jgi:hypothetical protein
MSAPPLDQVAVLIARPDLLPEAKTAGVALILLARHAPVDAQTVASTGGLLLYEADAGLAQLREFGLARAQPIYRSGEPSPDPDELVWEWVGIGGKGGPSS